MGKIIKRILSTFATVVALMSPTLVPVAVYAAGTIQDNLCGGVNLTTTTQQNCQNDTTAEGSVQKIIDVVIKWFSIIVGVISVVMIIYGGFKYITSGGDSGKVSSARNTIVYAIIGLVVVALAQLIVKFVLTKAVG